MGMKKRDEEGGQERDKEKKKEKKEKKRRKRKKGKNGNNRKGTITLSVCLLTPRLRSE